MLHTALTPLTAMACLALSGPTFAHPHAFIDTQFTVHLTADGLIEAVTIIWAYDALYTFIILEERGLDSDGDGLLTKAETAMLSGFDMRWQADFQGDTYLLAGGMTVALSSPQNWSATVEGGRVTSRHTRLLSAPLDPQTTPIIVKSYDPEYYTAYRITQVLLDDPVNGCSAQIFPFDPVVAQDVLGTALEGFVETAETPFPLVGEYFSDLAEVTCPQG